MSFRKAPQPSSSTIVGPPTGVVHPDSVLVPALAEQLRKAQLRLRTVNDTQTEEYINEMHQRYLSASSESSRHRNAVRKVRDILLNSSVDPELRISKALDAIDHI